MSYYLLPKKNNIIEILPSLSNDDYTPYISPSLYYHLNMMKTQLQQITENSFCSYSIDFLQKVVNPYEFIFTQVPGTKFSVSKVKPHSSSFYIFLELLTSINMFDYISNKNMRTLLYSSSGKSINDCLDILRENYTDDHTEISLNDIYNKNNYKEINNLNAIDFMFFELDDEQYENFYFLCFFYNVLHFQNHQGGCVIKLHDITCKAILDIIYLFTSLYDKVYILKPSTSNVCKNEKYLICKNYCFKVDYKLYYTDQIYPILDYYVSSDINSDINSNIKLHVCKLFNSIVKDNLPYYFLNKVEEANIIVGHQQLESIEQMINIVKNKNREDKIESLKKNNIQKCIQWCEKYKIPYNKFAERINIFLNAIVEEKEQEQEQEQYQCCLDLDLDLNIDFEEDSNCLS